MQAMAGGKLKTTAMLMLAAVGVAGIGIASVLALGSNPPDPRTGEGGRATGRPPKGEELKERWKGLGPVQLNLTVWMLASFLIDFSMAERIPPTDSVQAVPVRDLRHDEPRLEWRYPTRIPYRSELGVSTLQRLSDRGLLKPPRWLPTNVLNFGVDPRT